MKALNRALKGKRTYIVCTVAIAYLIGADLGYWPVNKEVIGIFAFLGAGFLRAATGR